MLPVADSCSEAKAVIAYVLASSFVQLAGEADCWRSRLSSDAWSKQAAQEIWRPLTCSVLLLSHLTWHLSKVDIVHVRFAFNGDGILFAGSKLWIVYAERHAVPLGMALV